MLIPIAVPAGDPTEVFIQQQGLRLARRIQTENDARDAQRVHIRLLAFFCTVSLSAIGLVGYALGNSAHVQEVVGAAWLNASLVGTGLLGLVGLGLSARLHVGQELCKLLSDRPAMEAQVHTAAATNRAVAAYLARVDADKRQLRVFDVAMVNELATQPASRPLRKAR